MKLKKGPWTREEDKKLLAYIAQHGHGSWRILPAKAGLQRCGKSCRLRWTTRKLLSCSMYLGFAQLHMWGLLLSLQNCPWRLVCPMVSLTLFMAPLYVYVSDQFA
ncbi:uncharacterized protein [Henckelia pumila]